jgi:hypothetical protein
MTERHFLNCFTESDVQYYIEYMMETILFYIDRYKKMHINYIQNLGK